MKKGFIGLLVLLLCAWVQSAYGAAGDAATVNGKAVADISTINGVSGASIATVCGTPYTDGDTACSSPDSNATSSGVASIAKDDANDSLHVASSFTSSSAYSLKSFTVVLQRTTTDPALTISGKICTDDSGKPSSTCTSADATVASSTLNTTDTTVRFKIAAGYSISNATRYWIVISASGLGTANNYLRRPYLNTGTESHMFSPDGSTWTTLDTSSTGVFATSTCEDE
jgi:hypothetical protein